ncbi:protporphyrin IX magnesium chelatase [Halovivax asiaticus JCM 14624]|uniref:Protporphyrin IX magnesium chelatase n=1 Tax=Halovivax asiaticus JCM 14624 TaxID=1227490 RepID=M0BLB8_9EURY|nr:VWA domain-containing protein [Halovivax asiaticus]ELZ11681.1 protporphyrin IX magnesium chelatase [Halovivax asiaticus JCM 14624]
MVVDPVDGAPSATTPFPAIVGQEELKRALVTIATNDALDGLLVQGEKGTAKSTAVRGLVDLLPQQRAVADCPYGCPPDDPDRQCADCRSRQPSELPTENRPVPLVTLPLGATRERVVGTLSVADALDGEATFDPGLLARANRGILYVDEVNLLDDHLVDVLLDAAADGVNRIERDGVSVAHPADFTLVGTMNPEEGDLRPQLRDRFALQATVVGCRDPADRVAVIDRALDRDGDPDAFARDYEAETAAIEARIREARERLPDVDLPPEFTRDIADLCLDAGIDGHRGDIAIARTARTLAALAGRHRVIEPDVADAARLALPHRMRSQPFDDAPDPEAVLDAHFDDHADENGTDDPDEDGAGGDRGRSDAGDGGTCEADSDRDGEPGDGREPSDDRGGGSASEPEERGDDDTTQGNRPDTARSRADDESRGESDATRGGATQQGPAETAGTEKDAVGRNDESDDPDRGVEEEPATPLVPGQRRSEIGDATRPPVEDGDVTTTTGDGDRTRIRPSETGRGARVRTERARVGDSVDAAASIRAAAANGHATPERDDLRTAVRHERAGTTIVFVVDASASMQSAMAAAKGTVMSLLQDAYEHREQVAFIAVAGDAAEVVLPPTDSVALAARHLKELPAGDRTPLPSGLDAAARLADHNDATATRVVVVSDGKATVAEGSPTDEVRRSARRLKAAGADVLVVDASDRGDRAGLLEILVSETGGRRIPLSALAVSQVTGSATDAPE